MKHQSRHIYVKSHGETVLDDWQRVNILAQLCQNQIGIRTAEPLWINLEEQSIGYERLDGLAPVMYTHTDLQVAMRRIGSAIGQLHLSGAEFGNFEPAERTSYPIARFGLSAEDEKLLLGSLPTGWFHSDCWHGNFFLRGDQILVIDPLPDGYTVQRGFFFANGAVDIAIMYMSLFLCRPLQAELRTNWALLLNAGKSLLDGYLAAVGAEDEEVRRAILRLCRQMAVNHVMSYEHRLATPLAQMKRAVGNVIIRRLDNELHWKNS